MFQIRRQLILFTLFLLTTVALIALLWSSVSTHQTSTPPVAANSLTHGFVVDHHAFAQFDQIPDNYIDAAVDFHLLFRHASVGVNISDGLDCLMNNFAGPRPNFCDRHLDPDEIYYDEKYDRSNWDFELHNDNNPNPGWWNKVDFFIDRVNGLPSGQYDVVAFKFGYVDGDTNSNIADHFFDAGSTFPNYTDLEALEAAHPDKTVVWWTMGLARAIGTQPSDSLNDQMRAYALANDKVLMDIADILSHTPDGQPCFHDGHPAMCEDYTTEQFGGHLNSRGMLYMAKAYWVLMARLAGWVPGDDPPPPPATSTPSPTPTPSLTPTPSPTPDPTLTERTYIPLIVKP